MLNYVIVGALVVALLLSIYSGILTNNSLQACLEKNRKGSASIAMSFHHCLGRATDIEYLLTIYLEGFIKSEPNVDNIEALIAGFFYEIEYAYWFLIGLKELNPELNEYGKPLYVIGDFIYYTFIGWEAYPEGETVRSVLGHLNVTGQVTAFKELNQTSFHKIDELGREVSESFHSFNATRLDNTVNMVEELQAILGQWIDKYS